MTRRFLHWLILGIPALFVASAACMTIPDDLEPKGNSATTGTINAALTIDADGGKDIGKVKFTIKRVPCAAETFPPLSKTIIKDLEDMKLPGNIPGFENKPLDENSSHHFADNFSSLPAGCYDVVAEPLQADGKPSKDCRQAFAHKVVVLDGKTTEIFLLLQCAGNPIGALDVVAAINHPPDITTITYNPSKFVYECEETIICATANDPDKDPIEFVWSQTSGPTPFSGFTVLSTTANADGSVTQCVKFVPQSNGNYGIQVTVYDLLWHAGKKMRVEDYLALKGYPADSHDTQAIPLYVNWDLELKCLNKQGQLQSLPGVRKVKRAHRCKWTTPGEYYCNPKHGKANRCCPKGQFNPLSVYPACN